MKNVIFGSLSALVILSFASPALSSEEVAAVDLNGSRNATSYLPPVTLVQLAYQGQFTNSGIPSNGGFKNAIITGRVNAETLVKSAIASGRLSPSVLDDEGYLNTIEIQLTTLVNN